MTISLPQWAAQVLLTASTVAASVTAYRLGCTRGKQRGRARRLQVVLLSSELLVAGVSAVSWYEASAAASRHEAQAARVGTLMAEETSHRIVRFPELEIGDSGAVLIHGGMPGAPLFDYGGDKLIIGLDARGRVLVSVVVRDQVGNVVAELVQNEWKVNPAGSWDRNYSNNALEVRDPRGDVVLQVRLVENRAHLQAKLFNREGNGFVVRAAGPGEGSGGILAFSPAAERDRLTIPPLFRYPSELHLGEFGE